ncbi:lysylphosphatidylglycerol synthase transmembrane domain-containing protein [Quadrisphaera oryzae]|uniref:lysylphosphatidylglycerol synthase transmembrane domain-containing protein n=1 Tax=Quadrisphaera TaxID=317661 RepID=UPI001645BDB8|nr:YbhN family protein [Quadrisphaera sp. RL12-1S]MBC3764093.1 UPF0104 family protein [Quadrisphaera sp. RL12-1S]
MSSTVPDLDATDATGATGGAARPAASWWRLTRWAVVVLLLGVVAVELVAGRRDVLRALRAVSDPVWWTLGLAALVDLASMVAYAVMQRRLLLGAGVPRSAARRRATTALAFEAHSLSISLPGGPVFSTAHNFARMTALGASRPTTTWVIAVSGVLSSAALALLGAVGGVWTGARGDLGHLLAAAGVFVVVVVAARMLGAHRAWASTAHDVTTAALTRLSGRRPRTGAALHRVHAGAHGLAAVRVRPSTWVWAGAGALANWVLDAAALWLCCTAAGLDGLRPEHVLLAYTAAMAAASFPLVPAGLGVVDAALTVGLVAAGATPGEALAADVLYRAVSLGLVGGSGWVLWALHKRPRGS